MGGWHQGSEGSRDPGLHVCPARQCPGRGAVAPGTRKAARQRRATQSVWGHRAGRWAAVPGQRSPPRWRPLAHRAHGRLQDGVEAALGGVQVARDALLLQLPPELAHVVREADDVLEGEGGVAVGPGLLQPGRRGRTGRTGRGVRPGPPAPPLPPAPPPPPSGNSRDPRPRPLTSPAACPSEGR